MVINCVLFSFCIILSLSFSPSTQQSCEFEVKKYMFYNTILLSNMKMKSQS